MQIYSERLIFICLIFLFRNEYWYKKNIDWLIKKFKIYKNILIIDGKAVILEG